MTFNAEEVRKSAAWMHQWERKSGARTARAMLEAYADTLSKPADSGRVGDVVAWCDAFDRDVAHWGLTHYLAARLKTAADMLRALAAQGQGELVEMSPEFTDTARGAIAWVLYHHQGGSSPIGQPLRFALGMGAHERISDSLLADAKRWAELSGATTAQFHPAPPASPTGVPDGNARWIAKAIPLLKAAVSWMPTKKCAMHIREIDALLRAAPSTPEVKS